MLIQVANMVHREPSSAFRYAFGSDAHGKDEMKLVFDVASCFDAVGLTDDDLMDFVRV